MIMPILTFFFIDNRFDTAITWKFLTPVADWVTPYTSFIFNIILINCFSMWLFRICISTHGISMYVNSYVYSFRPFFQIFSQKLLNMIMWAALITTLMLVILNMKIPLFLSPCLLLHPSCSSSTMILLLLLSDLNNRIDLRHRHRLVWTIRETYLVHILLFCLKHWTIRD